MNDDAPFPRIRILSMEGEFTDSFGPIIPCP